MRAFDPISKIIILAIAGLLMIPAAGRASTIWNGPSIGFYHTDANGLQDTWSPNFKISRSISGGGLINTAQGDTFGSFGSCPKNTGWAIGTLSTFTNSPGTLHFVFCPLEAGHSPAQFANGTVFVVHLTNDDIYLQLTLTNWGAIHGSGDHTFGYIRTTPSAAPPPPTPTVSITNPVTGATFGAPATVSIGAAASVSSGTVTNVHFFTNGVSLATVTTAPFTFTANNLVVGTYALKAVATAAGISATSTVVNFTVLPTPTISVTNPLNGAAFTAPATVSIGAAASVASGTVTNVHFFTNGISLATVTVAPFTFTANNLGVGSYSLTAVAIASGIAATSTPVSFSVTANTPPTVILTNPVNATVFAAPANLKLGATATPGNGPVTNVQFFANATTLLASATAPPFTAVSGSISAGAYSLTAVATAAGISVTSAPVNVSVVAPVSMSISSPSITAGLFSFSYTASPGLSYVVEGSSDLVSWLPLITNIPSVSPVPFSAPDTNRAQFYRIDQLPNP